MRFPFNWDNNPTRVGLFKAFVLFRMEKEKPGKLASMAVTKESNTSQRTKLGGVYGQAWPIVTGPLIWVLDLVGIKLSRSELAFSSSYHLALASDPGATRPS